MRHLLSIGDLSDTEFLTLSHPDVPNKPEATPLRGTLGLLFQQSSLRTMSSFATAGTRVGLAPVQAGVLPGDTLRERSELADEVRQLTMICRCVAVRARAELDPALRDMAEAPLVNAGDGTNEHPTQTLADIAVLRRLGVENGSKHVVLVGNMRDHRVNHSLQLALARLGVRVTAISPPGLGMPVRYCSSNLTQTTGTSDEEVDEALAKADFVYATPVAHYNQTDRSELTRFGISKARAERVLRKHAKVLHPFPRTEELAQDLDATQYNAYFDQTRTITPVRHRILEWLLAQ